MSTTMKAAVSSKLSQWAREAELNFARLGSKGVKMHRELWANGMVMVGPEGALANQMIPLDRAIAIFRAGWRVAG